MAKVTCFNCGADLVRSAHILGCIQTKVGMTDEAYLRFLHALDRKERNA